MTEANLTDAVLAKLEGTTDPRFKQIMSSLIRHLHAFVREVELTEREWFAAIQFLTATSPARTLCSGSSISSGRTAPP